MEVTILITIPLISQDLYRIGLSKQTLVVDDEVYGLSGCIERSVMVVPIFLTCYPGLLLLEKVLF